MYTYDTLAKLTGLLTTDTIGKYGKRDLYEFDTAGRILADTEWIENKSLWTYNLLTVYAYDSLGRYKNKITKTWISSQSIWRDSLVDSITYNDTGWVHYYSNWDSYNAKIVQDKMLIYVYYGSKLVYFSNTYFWDGSNYQLIYDLGPLFEKYNKYGLRTSYFLGYWGVVNYFDKEWLYDSLKRLAYEEYLWEGYSYRRWNYFDSRYTNIVESKSNTCNSISISPNPSIGVFNLCFASEFTGKIEIFGISGKLVYSEYVANVKTYPVNFLGTKGLYIVKVTDPASSQVFKIIRE